jgi:hypothetical protein
MPFTNFDSRHFTQPEKDNINDLFNQLEAALTPKSANLSPEERQQYGSINEQNKLFVNKVLDYQNSQPALSSPDVDWAEFVNDADSRSYTEAILQRASALAEGIKNAKILHDHDSYQNALTDYDYTKYKMGTSTPGYETKYNELKQFFERNTPPTPPTE